jgi:hypothetical protein
MSENPGNPKRKAEGAEKSERELNNKEEEHGT